jgi:hypothetical protein
MAALTQNPYMPWMPYQSDAQETSRGALAQNIPYDYPVKIESTNAVDITFGVGEIDTWSGANQRHTVKRPTADSIDCAKCVVLPGAKFPINSLAVGSLYPVRPLIARYETADGEPAVGDALGTKADSWKMSKGNSGFICLGIVDATEGLCLVRPFASSQRVVLGHPLNLTSTASVTISTIGSNFGYLDGTETDLVGPITLTTSGSITVLCLANSMGLNWTGPDPESISDFNMTLEAYDSEEGEWLALGTNAFDTNSRWGVSGTWYQAVLCGEAINLTKLRIKFYYNVYLATDDSVTLSLRGYIPDPAFALFVPAPF